ncbi:tryptophan 2,3-dioxygenase family protein [Actinoplanes sp. NPDC023801]|uniref:tryptophan 2,3-dioxygenase family protein n=1 Tax=Actinoplanes sp. NPDC023801 TaxID=3154595 RepID=UPI00340D22E0
MEGRHGNAGTQALDLDYHGYLLTDQLLALQHPKSEPIHADEMHFIITHQAIELWFRLMVQTVRRARDEVSAGRWIPAVTAVRQLTRFTGVVIAQTSTLAEMPPASFHAFRHFLGTSSGFQSLQFRELEVLSGLRDEHYLAGLRRVNGGVVPPSVAEALAEPSLAGALEQAAARAGVVDWANFYADEGGRSPLYLLCEALIDYDEAWFRWRSEHRILVERMLGGSIRGTAGTTPSYLERSTHLRFFPYLWQARSELALMGGGMPTQF